MKKACLLILAIISGFGLTRAQEIDVTRLDKIGSVTSYVETEKGITLNCSDNSQVQLTVLAADLIRVRASFAKPIPAKDHSWAIAKDNWEATSWNLRETDDAIIVVT